MTTPISGRSTLPVPTTVRTNVQTPRLTPNAHVQAGAEGTLQRERTLRESFGVDRFDPATNARLPPQAREVAALVPELVSRDGQVGGSVAALQARGELGAVGSVAVNGEGRVLAGDASAQGSVRVNGEGVRANGEVRAAAVLADGSVEAAEGRLRATASAGAVASLSGDLTLDPSTGNYRGGVTVDNFAGIRAEAQARLGTENVSVTGRAGVQLGAGATLRLEAGLQNNRLRGRLELGAALGIGVRAGVSVDVNLQPAVSAARRVVENAAGATGRAVGDAAGWVGRQLPVGELLRHAGQSMIFR